MESIAVLGGGESGVGAALLAKKLGINVFVSDYGTIPEKYKTDPISSAYASNLEYLTEQFTPDLWIHGHIHTPCDYKLNRTRIICNPHGYISEKYNGYQKELIIEV